MGEKMVYEPEDGCIEGMCCDCTHDEHGFCGDYSENVSCHKREESGVCWMPLPEPPGEEG